MQKIISYIYIIWQRIIEILWRNSLKQTKLNGVVLMYHHISDTILDEVPYSCQHTTQEFINSLDSVREDGYSFITLSELLDVIDSKDERKVAVVTFDDIPLSVYEVAYPILKENNIPFTVFITTDFIGQPGFVTEEQLLIMSDDMLCTVGAHTCSHPFLRKLANCMDELLNSKEWLEYKLGKTVRFLAYPYGKFSSVSRKVIRCAKAVGYTCAFGTIDAHITDFTSKYRFFLPRIVLK